MPLATLVLLRIKTLTQFIRLFLDKKLFRKAIYKTKVENMDIVPANIDLSGVEVELVYMQQREFVIKKLLMILRIVMII